MNLLRNRQDALPCLRPPSILLLGLFSFLSFYYFPTVLSLYDAVPILDLPVIDIGPLLTRDDDRDPRSREILAKMSQAISEFGVFYITGCGPLCEDVHAAALFEAAAAVLDAGRRHPVPRPPHANPGFVRGYIGVGGESGLVGDVLETKEGFSYGHPWDDGEDPATAQSFPARPNPLQGRNLWPTGFSRRRRALLETSFGDFSRLAARLSAALLRPFLPTAPEDFLGDGDTISFARIFHYLPSREAAGADGATGAPLRTLGSSAHTDWGLLTLILQSENALQVLDGAGRWRAVPPVPRTLVVNGGDYLAILSGQTYVSPIHRVDHGEVDRTSFVYFYYPEYGRSLYAPSSSAAAAACEARGKKTTVSEEDGEGGSRSVKYNTLAVEDAECMMGGTTTITFGDWISKKWAGVQDHGISSGK